MNDNKTIISANNLTPAYVACTDGMDTDKYFVWYCAVM